MERRETETTSPDAKDLGDVRIERGAGGPATELPLVDGAASTAPTAPQYEPLSEHESAPSNAAKAASSRDLRWGLALAGLALLALGVWWYWPTAPTAPATSSTPQPLLGAAPSDVADTAVQESVTTQDAEALEPSVLARVLSAHPQFLLWLAEDRIVERTVAVIANVAFDEPPSSHVPFLKPEGAFAVATRSGRTVIAPESYRRFDLLADVFSSIETAEAVRLYEQMRPRLSTQFGALGYPGSFDEALSLAFERLLEVPDRDDPPEVEAAVSSYRYVDPALEALTPGQKILVRAGPQNRAKIQAKLRDLRGRLIPGSAGEPGH